MLNRRSTELQRICYCLRGTGPKWAAYFRISHFHNQLQSFICLRSTIPKPFKRVRVFGGLQGGSGQTSENGLFRLKWAFSEVCPEPPWRPPNPLTLSKGFGIVPLKHIIDRSWLWYWKWDILKYAAHFGLVPLRQVGKLCSSIAVFFGIFFPIFFMNFPISCQN